MAKSKKTKTTPVKYGDPDPSDSRTHNPFLPEPEEDSPYYATPYHRYRAEDGTTIEYVRHVDDHIGFIRVLIEPEPKGLPADLKDQPWTGFADLHRKVLQFFEGKNLSLSIMSPHEEFADKASKYIDDRDYAKGRRFDTR